MFNVLKFQSLSSVQQLKKLAFCLRDQLLNRQGISYYKEMIEWLNLNAGYRFMIPTNTQEMEALYQELLNRITQDDPYQEKVMFDDIGKERTVFPIILILDNVRSPFNVGSFFRTAESLGVSEIWLIGISPQPAQNTKISRTAKGAIIHHRYFKDYSATLDALNLLEHKIVIGIEKTPLSKNLIEIQSHLKSRFQQTVLIFGNEEFGISKDLLDHCQHIYHIPLLGTKNSINVGVAAGIVLYHISNHLSSLNGEV